MDPTVLTGDRCCRRRCTPLTKCDHDTLGCFNDGDCNDGLECVGTGLERKCLDIDECTDPRFISISQNFCGLNTTCVNHIGNYSCSCNPGKENWIQVRSQKILSNHHRKIGI